MPFIGKPCDKCKSIDKPVYERYRVTGCHTVRLRREPLSGRLISDEITYWCNDCSKKELEKDNGFV